MNLLSIFLLYVKKDNTLGNANFRKPYKQPRKGKKKQCAGHYQTMCLMPELPSTEDPTKPRERKTQHINSN